MVRARMFDTKAVNLQRTGKLGTYPSCLGHEATHVGVGAAMRPEDVLFTVYREIGTKFWRGVDMLDVLLYWGGDERGTDLSAHAAGFSVLRADRLADAAGGRRRARDADPRRAALRAGLHRRRRHLAGCVLRGDQFRRRQVAAAGVRDRQ